MAYFIRQALRDFADCFLSVGRGGRMSDDLPEVARPQSIDRYFANVGVYLSRAHTRFLTEHPEVTNACQ